MGDIFRRAKLRFVINEDFHHIDSFLQFFNIDIQGDTSLLGYGAYKEVHRTKWDGTVLIITDHPDEFYFELKMLKRLENAGLPVIKHLAYVQIGPLVFVLAKEYSVPKNLSYDKKERLKEKVKEYLLLLFQKGIIVDDLQYFTDENEDPIFYDPWRIKIADKNKYMLEALCKSGTSDLNVYFKTETKG